MEKNTLSELDKYLAEVEAELKAIQNKLGVDIDLDPEDIGEINLEEADINRLTEIYDNISQRFSEIDLEDEDETN
jgi:malic enzyme